MVSLSRLRMLDRKLIRDLWAMKGQALAIAMVVGAGVTMFVTYLSNFESLQQTRGRYYAESRFADVFASLTRAPRSLVPRIGAVPGVGAVNARVVMDVTLDVPGMAEPAVGRLISLPAGGQPLLNAVHLRRGRWVEPARADEVLASETFCETHGLGPGDQVSALVNGRYRRLTIVGVALSPEYVYAIRPGEMVPDAKRFGVFWMGGAALGAAFNMEGAFNDLAIAVDRGASVNGVIAEVDRLLEPYGGRGAVPQALQVSAWTLENELAQLQIFGLLVPAIFFGISVFILHVALTRALALQRAQIAAMKALGYSNASLGWHYVKWALTIAAAGAAAGVALGGWLGSQLIQLYNQFFRFPSLDYHLSWTVAAASVAGSLAAAALGAQAAVRRAVRVPPAEAMRPEAPARHRRSVAEWFPWRLALTTRMILRNLERQPGRAASSVLGIAFAVASLLVGLAFIDVVDVLVEEQFTTVMRQDATIAFVQPRAAAALHDVGHLPGVIEMEPLRFVPVKLRSGVHARTVALAGLPESPRLHRVVDRVSGAMDALPPGIVLSRALGRLLDVAPGSTVQVDVLEGRRGTHAVTVAALVDDVLGLNAYMRGTELGRLLGEGATVSAVAVTLDPAQRDRFYARVKTTPGIAGVALRDATVQNFRDTMAANMHIQIAINVVFAAIIAFGVVYNAARVSLSERSRELASLRVLGFTRGEISLILLGELAVLTAAALPVGLGIGHALGQLIVTAFNNELYRMSFVATTSTVGWAWLVVAAAAGASGLIVRRRLDTLDLVAVLKAQE